MRWGIPQCGDPEYIPLELRERGQYRRGWQGLGLAGRSVLLKLVSKDLDGGGVGWVSSMCFGVVSATCLLFFSCVFSFR